MKDETIEERGARLDVLLPRLRPEELPRFFREEGEGLLTGPRPFAAYVRRKLREKGILQQTLFLAADISEGYGYKLLSEEKRTRRRDVLLRVFLAAGFRPEEVREALLLYGMPPLHGLFPRDAVLLTVFGSGLRDAEAVDALLLRFGFAPLGEETGEP